MDKEQVKQFIKQQRTAGIPDVEIHSFLVSKGAVPAQASAEPAKPKRSFGIRAAEKVADFTGGKELAQGLGQALAQRGTAKKLDEQLASLNKQQAGLIAKRRELQALGEDTTKIDKALGFNMDQLQQLGEGAEEQLNPADLSGREVVGSALQLGTTVAGLGALPGQAAKVAGATTFAKGAAAGAKAGGVFGAVEGVASGLKDEEKGVGDVIKTAATGAVTGAAVGGILGGISGAVKGRKIAKKAALESGEDVIDAITPEAPEVGSKQYKDLLSRGQIQPKTALSPAKIVISESDKAAAVKYRDLIAKDPVQSSINLREQIAHEDALVGKFLKKNNGIFNSGELKNQLTASMDDVVDLTVSEDRLAKAKTTLVDGFMKDLKENDMESLWKLRKTYDKQIEKAFSGSVTLQKEMKKALRNSVQDFIGDRTEAQVYKTSMKDMRSLFNLADLVESKAVKQKNFGQIGLWIKKNPTKAKVAGATAGAVVGSKVLGVGPFD